MMHGHEKSDSAIVATKLPNKAGKPAAEAVERKAGTKGNTLAILASGGASMGPDRMPDERRVGGVGRVGTPGTYPFGVAIRWSARAWPTN